MNGDLPVWVWLPLSIGLMAAFLYQTRASWLAFLGLKEKK